MTRAIELVLASPWTVCAALVVLIVAACGLASLLEAMGAALARWQREVEEPLDVETCGYFDCPSCDQCKDVPHDRPQGTTPTAASAHLACDHDWAYGHISQTWRCWRCGDRRGYDPR